MENLTKQRQLGFGILHTPDEGNAAPKKKMADRRQRFTAKLESHDYPVWTFCTSTYTFGYSIRGASNIRMGFEVLFPKYIHIPPVH